MFDSRGYPRDEVPRRCVGEVLTVVDSAMRSRLDAAVGAVAHPVHLDSLFAAITAATARPVRAVLVGPGTIDGDVSPGMARLVRACAGGALVVVVGSWTPGLAERLLAFGSYGIRDVVDVTRADELSRLRVILDRPEWEVSQRIEEMIRPSLAHATEEMQYFVSSLIRLAPEICHRQRVWPRSLVFAATLRWLLASFVLGCLRRRNTWRRLACSMSQLRSEASPNECRSSGTPDELLLAAELCSSRQGTARRFGGRVQGRILTGVDGELLHQSARVPAPQHASQRFEPFGGRSPVGGNNISRSRVKASK